MEDKRYFLHSKRYHEQIKKTNDKQGKILTNVLIFLICKELLKQTKKKTSGPIFFMNRKLNREPKEN